MSDRGVEYKVGLLIVSAIAVAVALVVVLGGFSFRSGYTIAVDYNFSGNVKPGAPVKLAGIKVGRVEDVRLMDGKIDEATGRRVLVRVDLWIEDRVKKSIRQDAEFFINTSGVLGEQYLEIVPGDDYENAELGAGVVVRGMDPPRTDLIVSRLFMVLDSLSKVLVEDRDYIRQLLVDGAGTVRKLNGLLSENREELSELITSTGTLADEAGKTLATVNEGLSANSIRNTMRGAESLMSTAESSIRKVTPKATVLLGDATRVTGMLTEKKLGRALKVADEAVALGGKAGRLVGNVDGMVTDIRAGKGSVGALLVREEIYADLREMLRDLKKNPWKFFWKE
ncbi:MAG: MCE family protein [Myxococcales bacterium]|nr:MCE family protein [Myxococcales bacterium]